MTRQTTDFSIAKLPIARRVPAVLIVAALIGSVLTSGCKPKSDAQASAPRQAVQAAQPVPEIASPTAQEEAPRQDAKREAVAAPKEEAAGGRAAVSIAGGWVNAGGACDSGASVFFNPDGTYMTEGEKGTWALSGKTLTVTTTTNFDEAASTTQGPDESTGDIGEKSVLTLLSVTDDAARVVLSNGSNANWTRCNS
jgi:hypothetical protein